MSRILFALFCFITVCVAQEDQAVVNFNYHKDNTADINECVDQAMERLMDATCLQFRQESAEESQVTFMQSSHCAWQKENKTIHLNSDCISDDICLELVGRGLSVDQPRHHIIRHVNLHFNCSNKCTIDCLNGGKVNDLDCSCSCEYGFIGKRCESLERSQQFTDSSCGIIEAQSTGHIALSTYPGERSKTTFCQWLIRSDDPWTIIDVEIESLGLDNVKISRGLRCNDVFTVYGTDDVTEPIPCDNQSNITQIHSTSNWLLFELRTNPWSEQAFKGPSLHYSTHKVQPGIRIFSEGMSASAGQMSLTVLLLIKLFI